jgi:hypothetical protein
VIDGLGVTPGELLPGISIGHPENLIDLSSWKEILQYTTSESRTRFSFQIQSYAGPDHSIARPFETRKKSPRTSLNRFIKKRVMNKIFFMPKLSRLVRKCPVRLSNGRNKMAAKPFESRTNRSGPDHSKTGLTSLDRFVMNKIFFMTLISKTVYVSNHLKTGK